VQGCCAEKYKKTLDKEKEIWYHSFIKTSSLYHSKAMKQKKNDRIERFGGRLL